MIPFLRQLRHRLITDNKVSKYLLYAVGEVLLIIFGILIALQVDSWNEDRKNVQLEHAFLERLRTDLSTDTVYLTRRIKVSEDIIKNGDYILREMYNNQEGFKDFVALTDRHIWDSEHLVIQKTTFNELNNTGLLNLLSNTDLKNDILQHYFKYEAISSHVKEANEFSVGEMSKIIAILYKSRRVVDILENTEMEAEMNWQFINDPQSQKFIELETAVGIYRDKHEMFKQYFENSLERSRILLEQIANELNRKP